MTKTEVTKMTFEEMVPVEGEPDRFQQGKTGWVAVYDDYSIEWEYDRELGNNYPHVRKTIKRFQLKDKEDRTVLSGGSSIADDGEDEMRFHELGPGAIAASLRTALQLTGEYNTFDDPKEYFVVRNV